LGRFFGGGRGGIIGTLDFQTTPDESVLVRTSLPAACCPHETATISFAVKRGRSDMKKSNVLGAAATVLCLGIIGASGAHAESFRLCEGEYFETWKGQCPASEPYAYCKAAEAEATRICRAQGASGKPLMVTLRSIPGNKCGYTTYSVTCQ
jgi:hypothetical protein